MRNGYKVYDSDTHIQPSLETIEPYLDPDIRARLPELEQYLVSVTYESSGLAIENPTRHVVRPGVVRYRRILGQAGPPEKPVTNYGKFQGTRHPSRGTADYDVEARLRDMDEEGVDVCLMVPNVPMGLQIMDDPALEMGFIRAYNRYFEDFCSKAPDRLKALMVVTGRDVPGSVAELKKWSKARWAVGAWPFPGMEMPMDHPDMEPIWKAMEEEGLAIVNHSLAWDPPFWPGYRDVWDNLFIGRAGAHPWGAMRALASFIGSGIMDRYPSIRLAILESGCGWLPFWARRLEDQADYVGTTAPLQHKVGEYFTNGRFFSSIEMHEGEDMIKMVRDFLGEDVLMYASDYPHPESRFPDSVDSVLAWESLSGEAAEKVMWKNAVRLYGEP